tara:strand:- start:311 stop:601 length:291 start_codon:yes stop_codon:yes gene_type:complete
VVKTKKNVLSQNSQMYLKAVQLRNIDQVSSIKDEVSSNMIVILRITPLAQKNIQDLKQTVEELYGFVSSIGGDIARLGDERVILTPPGVKVWRGLN